MADTEYTPTTGQVFDLAILGAMDAIGEDLDVAGFRDQFDRWLAEHDREVAAKALREAAGGMRRWKQAGTWYLPDPHEPGDVSYSPDRWLEVWADRIEKGEEQ